MQWMQFAARPPEVLERCCAHRRVCWRAWRLVFRKSSLPGLDCIFQKLDGLLFDEFVVVFQSKHFQSSYSDFLPVLWNWAIWSHLLTWKCSNRSSKMADGNLVETMPTYSNNTSDLVLPYPMHILIYHHKSHVYLIKEWFYCHTVVRIWVSLHDRLPTSYPA